MTSLVIDQLLLLQRCCDVWHSSIHPLNWFGEEDDQQDCTEYCQDASQNLDSFKTCQHDGDFTDSPPVFNLIGQHWSSSAFSSPPSSENLDLSEGNCKWRHLIPHTSHFLPHYQPKVEQNCSNDQRQQPHQPWRDAKLSRSSIGRYYLRAWKAVPWESCSIGTGTTNIPRLTQTWHTEFISKLHRLQARKVVCYLLGRIYKLENYRVDVHCYLLK